MNLGSKQADEGIITVAFRVLMLSRIDTQAPPDGESFGFGRLHERPT